MKKIIDFVMLFFATGCGLGFSPVAPGTAGTLLGVVLYYLLQEQSIAVKTIILLAVIIVSIISAQFAGIIFGVVDDGRIVIDEIAGYMVATYLIPFTWINAVILFVLFRVFDIWKPFPIRYIDTNIKNGFGVTVDDLMAGLYAFLLGHALQFVYPILGI